VLATITTSTEHDHHMWRCSLTTSLRTFTLVDTDDRTAETRNGQPVGDHTPVPHYEIRVNGHLGSRWAAWFDGMTLTNEDDGTTVISGPVVDQAALHGVLQKLRDLGIALRSLTELGPVTDIEHPIGHPRPNAPGATS
jgi:hypothetical protein